MRVPIVAIFALLATCIVPAALADYRDDDREDCDAASKRLLLNLSDSRLYEVGVDGIADDFLTINCQIIDAIGKPGSCDLYVKVCPQHVCGLALRMSSA